MKHKIDDTQVDVKLDIPIEDLETLIDKVTESVLVMIAAATVAHIVKKHV